MLLPPMTHHFVNFKHRRHHWSWLFWHVPLHWRPGTQLTRHQPEQRCPRRHIRDHDRQTHSRIDGSPRRQDHHHVQWDGHATIHRKCCDYYTIIFNWFDTGTVSLQHVSSWKELLTVSSLSRTFTGGQCLTFIISVFTSPTFGYSFRTDVRAATTSNNGATIGVSSTGTYPAIV